MLNRVFPQRFDNNYRGHKLALWLFIPIVLMKVGISLSSIFDTYNVVRSADGIPIDAFTPRGAEAVVSVTTLLGLSQFLLASLGVLALVRYRAMIPLMYVLLLVEYSCQKMDSTCETHRKDRDITQHLRKSGAHRGPCSVAPN